LAITRKFNNAEIAGDKKFLTIIPMVVSNTALFLPQKQLLVNEKIINIVNFLLVLGCWRTMFRNNGGGAY